LSHTNFGLQVRWAVKLGALFLWLGRSEATKERTTRKRKNRKKEKPTEKEKKKNK